MTAAFSPYNAAAEDQNGFPAYFQRALTNKEPHEYEYPNAISVIMRNINERGLENFAYLCGLVA